MHVYDAKGQRVSLLNDDPPRPGPPPSVLHLPHHAVSNPAMGGCDGTPAGPEAPVRPRLAASRSGSSASRVALPPIASFYQPLPYSSTSASSPTPVTPALTRAGSFDSRASNNDPVTPASAVSSRAPFDLPSSFGRRRSRPDLYDAGAGPLRHHRPISEAATPYHLSPAATTPYEDGPDYMQPRRKAFADPPPPPPYDLTAAPDEAVASVAEKPTKRYPCKFRSLYNCDRTFTTSGHASRHSKIHTAEKGVPCTFKGCTKKFTRVDNMKQHQDTHTRNSNNNNSSSSSSNKPRPTAPRPARGGTRRNSAGSGQSPLTSASRRSSGTSWLTDHHVLASPPQQTAATPEFAVSSSETTTVSPWDAVFFETSLSGPPVHPVNARALDILASASLSSDPDAENDNNSPGKKREP